MTKSGRVVGTLVNAPLLFVLKAEQNMGMPVANEHRWSIEDVWAIPDDPQHRYESVDGELLVSPSPRRSHQVAVARLVVLLDAYVDQHRLGVVLPAPSDVVLDAFTLVQPDVYVLPLVGGQRVGDNDPPPTPLLAIEVSSPTTARFDRLVKRPRYQRAGIEYWVVDLDSRLIERWLPAADRPEICVQELFWHPPGASLALQFDVQAYVNYVCGAV